MSIFVISIIAAKARWVLFAFGSFHIGSMPRQYTCQESP